MTSRQPLHLILLPAALGLAAACVVPQAAANSGTITFTGETTAATCIVEGGTENLPTFGVALPPVSSSLLGSIGDLAGRTRFSMRLRDCNGVENSVRAHFEPGATVHPASGTLRPSNDGPVHFALFDEDGTPIDIGARHDGPAYAPDTMMFYEVAYQRVGAGPIVAGTFNSTVAYTLQYD
jgi:major type 1 subunit fimbrin (pilin)